MSTSVQADSTAATFASPSEEGTPAPSFILLPGDIELELEPGGSIRFDSLLEWRASEEPKSIRFKDAQYFAGNKKGLGPLLLGAKNKRLRLAPDKFCVTLIRDPENALGKVFDANGKKSASVTVVRATAMTHRCETHEKLAALYERAGEDPHAALILDYFPGIPVGEPFEVLSEKRMREALSIPAGQREDVLGVQSLQHGDKPYLAVTRLKENLTPSVWVLVDRDIDLHTPKHLAELDDADYFKTLAKALPGIDKVTRIRTLSSSARAVNNGEARRASS